MLLPSDLEPIAALVTPASAGGALAVVRVSGERAHQLVLSCCRLVNEAVNVRHGVARRIIILDPADQSQLDDAVAIFYAAPRSYTGQDMVEISCHGSSYIIQRLLKILTAVGARLALPGEFTKRAFLLGKLDLTQAEGINDLIGAESQAQWAAARYLTEGRLAKFTNKLRADLLEALSLLAVIIDFPDEHESGLSTLTAVDQYVSAAINTLQKMLATFESGRIARSGLRVLLAGAPNAGKSTLFNALLERPRAIVTAIAGTTRDYLEESLLINGYLVRLVDSAGLRESDDPLEKLGIDASKELLNEVDLVLYLVEANRSLSALEQQLLADAKLHQKTVIVRTKIDLINQPPLEAPVEPLPYLTVSSLSGANLELLRAAVAERAAQAIGVLLPENGFITNERQRAALQRSYDHLLAYQQGVVSGLYEECLGSELQAATNALSEVIGVVSIDDVLERVFAQFCLGK